MPYGRTGYRCSSQGMQTSGTLQVVDTEGAGGLPQVHPSSRVAVGPKY